MTSANPVGLIVGMGPGLSAALARRFAAAGYTIAGFSRSNEKSAALAHEMTMHGHRLALRAVDAGDFEALGQAIRAVDAEVGPVEVLIYNAYRATFTPPSHLPVEELVADFRVNVGGALAATQAVLPLMRARGKGTVLLTGGGLALDPTGWLPAASLAVGKAGLRNLTQSLHKEMEKTPVRVATITVAGQIAPGTDFAPELIAERFWQIHTMAGATPAELVYSGHAAEPVSAISPG